MTPKKKVLIYSDCFTFGGCENIVLNLLNSDALNQEFTILFAYAYSRRYKRGFEAHSTRRGGVFPLLVLSNSAIFYSLKLANLQGLKSALALMLKVFLKVFEVLGIYTIFNFVYLYRTFREFRPDILYINNGGYPGAASCRVAVFSATAAGVKRIYFHVNNLACPPRWPFEGLLDHLLAQRIELFITGSKVAGNALIERRGFDGGRIVNIPNTPVAQRQSNKYKPSLRELRGYNGDVNVIGAVGLLTRRKGFDILIRAVGSLKCENKLGVAKVYIFGEGEERDSLEKLVEEFNLRECVFLPGHDETVTHYMRDFNVLVQPSIDYEDCPYAIVEAMAQGVPIIGTRVGGIPEQIDHAQTGWLVEPGNPKTLAEAIHEAISNPELLKRMGSQAEAKFAKRYANIVVMQSFINLLREPVEGERKTLVAANHCLP